MLALVPYLEQRGVDTRFVVLPKRPEWLRVWRLHETWRQSNLLVFSKLKLLAGERSFVATRCPRWVLDIDDAVMLGKPRRHGDPPDDASWRRWRFQRMVARCSLVVAGSRSLAEMIGTTVPAIEVLPTPVDLRSYPVIARPTDDTLRLAWIGLGANLRYLEDLGPVLQELGRGGLKLELRVISDRLPNLPSVPCQLVSWNESEQGRDLASCDIGLAPMPDDPWTRGKGGYRCIQYAAAGLPTITSPVGANCEIVTPWQTGLWATTPAEWLDSLRFLAANPGLRVTLGQAARERAAAFDLPLFGARYVELLLARLGAAGGHRQEFGHRAA